jgi:hypothetical protein
MLSSVAYMLLSGAPPFYGKNDEAIKASIFDPNELELIICGLPTIDMNDWESSTIYLGLYESSKGKRDDKVVEWFWEVV